MSNRIHAGISGRTGELFTAELTQPDASKYTILLDTTNGNPKYNNTAPGKSTAVPTVGSLRGQALGNLYGFTVRCTGQDCTVLQYLLDGSAAWTLFASTTITAGAAAQSFTWDPSAYGSGDALVLVQAGATPPTNTYATLNVRRMP